jgi:hypothetical protein
VYKAKLVSSFISFAVSWGCYIEVDYGSGSVTDRSHLPETLATPSERYCRGVPGEIIVPDIQTA